MNKYVIIYGFGYHYEERKVLNVTLLKDALELWRLEHNKWVEEFSQEEDRDYANEYKPELVLVDNNNKITKHL